MFYDLYRNRIGFVRCDLKAADVIKNNASSNSILNTASEMSDHRLTVVRNLKFLDVPNYTPRSTSKPERASVQYPVKTKSRPNVGYFGQWQNLPKLNEN